MTSLKKQLADVLKNKVHPGIKKNIEVAAEEVGEALVDSATVDTGLFAANYRVGIDVERRDDLDYEHFGVTDARSGKRSITVAQAKEVATDIPDFELGSEIIWSNSVEHLKYFDFLSDATLGALIGRDKANSKVGK